MSQEQRAHVSAHPKDVQTAADNVTAAVEQARAMGFEMGRRQPATNTKWVDGRGNPASEREALDVLTA